MARGWGKDNFKLICPFFIWPTAVHFHYPFLAFFLNFILDSMIYNTDNGSISCIKHFSITPSISARSHGHYRLLILSFLHPPCSDILFIIKDLNFCCLWAFVFFFTVSLYPYMREITQYLPFSFRLTSLSITVSRSIPIATKCVILSFLIA